MKHSTRPPTKAEQMRFEAIKQVGCIPCWLVGFEFEPCTIQHVVEGQKRCGHSMTYGCCSWHHFGHPKPGLTQKETEEILGPSLALSKKRYKERFGTERELVELCSEMIKGYLQAWQSEYS